MKYAVFNPHNKPESDLPTIYGFNNGGQPGWYSGLLIAEDGAVLGSHICSHEDFMYGDLGILPGTRPDRHETFKSHYPEGYKMDFVRRDDVLTHPGLTAAYELNQKLRPEAKGDHASVEIEVANG